MAAKMSLAAAMNTHNVSRRKLAEDMGVHVTTVGQWLRGRNPPHGPNKDKIDGYFDCRISYPADIETPTTTTTPNIVPESSTEFATLDALKNGFARVRVDKVMPIKEAMEVFELLS